MATRTFRLLIKASALLAASAPASALTITPYYDSTIIGAANQALVQSAVTTAVSTINGLYKGNASGTLGIVFSQANGGFLGQSETTDYFLTYSSYISALAAASANEPGNTTLATAVANLSKGNDSNGAKNVALTAADAKFALGLSGVSGAFSTNASNMGTYVGSCGTCAFGLITLTDNPALALNYGTTAVAGAYSMINTVEHEINEILGGGGQGSMLNAVAAADSPFNAAVGVLDLYRYSAPNTPSFSISSSATSYFSVDGGVTDIIGFNQSSGGDFADFITNTNVQSAFTSAGGAPNYTAASPEFAMLESIGYNGVPEPASMMVLGSGLGMLAGVRRRRRDEIC